MIPVIPGALIVIAALTGTASFYDYHPHQAAAGPKLRKALGPQWRGSTVTVCKNDTCVKVTLTDWCQCYKGEDKERIIDLDRSDFATLAPTWRGLTKVRIDGLDR